jgi:hypothetical protein
MSEIQTARKSSSRPGAAADASNSVESWLVIVLLSLVPLVGALFAPQAWRAPLYIVGGVVCAVGLVLLVVQESRRGQDAPGR